MKCGRLIKDTPEIEDRIKLEEKGPIIPPPKLDALSGTVSRTIQCWDDIVAVAHWDLFDPTRVDGADFYVGEEELGHIHLNGDLNLSTTKAIHHALTKAEMAVSLPYGSGNKRWVLYSIREAAHPAPGTWLFRLSYNRLTGTPETDLLQRFQSCRSTLQVVYPISVRE